MFVLKAIAEFFKHTFLPRTSNNQRPRILHPAGLSLLVGIFLLNFSLRTLISYLPGFVLGFRSTVSVNEVIALTNQERLKVGLPPLKENSILSQAAQSKASDMFLLDYWAHVSPTGTQPWTFIKSAGYVYRFAGENLARDFADTTTLTEAWMASPSHRENILSSNYSDIGVAVIDGRLQGVETRLVVQMFGSPATIAVAQVEPSTPAQTAQRPISQTSPALQISPPAAEEKELEEAEFLAQGGKRQEANPQFAGATALEAVTRPLREERIISPAEITQAFGIILVSLILGTLVVDWVIAHRHRTVRLVGRNWAHITYMGIIALMLMQYAQGRVL